MNVLVVCGHPRAASFCTALADAYARGAREAGCTVRRLALAAMRFDADVHTASPLQQALEPDLQEALAALEWATHVVIVYPAWWGFAPARLKGFLDRVLLPGRAFRERQDGSLEGLMGGRTAHLLTTMDMPPWVYRFIYRGGGHQVLRRSTLGVCGIRCTRIASFGPVNHSDAARRCEWLQRAHALGLSLADGARSRRQRSADATRAWLRAMRLQFFPMSWLAYTLGAVAAQGTGLPWQSRAYWFGYASLFLIKLATVLSNERFDFESDRVNRQAGAFNGGSRVLVDGSLTHTQLRDVTLLALLAAGGCAVVALAGAIAPVAALLVLLLSAVAALGYTAPPLRLSWRGLGEVDVALTHSIGVILWGWLLQGGAWRGATPWALSLPLGLAILPAILLSSLPDREADSEAGKRTLAVRHGPRVACMLAIAAATAAFASAWSLDAALDHAYSAILPFIGAHLLLLAWLMYRPDRHDRPASRGRSLQAPIVVALAYIMWFVLGPLLLA